MSTLSTDVRLKDSPKGPHFIGNLRFPATGVDVHDLVVKVFPDGTSADGLKRLMDEPPRLYWKVVLEPVRPSHE